MELLPLRVAYIGLILYNFCFLVGKFMPDLSLIQPVYAVIDQYTLYFVILEILAVIAIFVDLITNFDSKPKFRKNLSLSISALLFVGFFVKIFLIWFHASLILD